MKRILKIAIDTLLYVVIAILLCYIVLRAANKIGIYKVMTGSMEDGIHAGDYIIVNHTKDLKLGDVITYTRHNYYITHRIVDITPNGLITKGDANNTEDDPVQLNEVVGKVLYKSALIKFIITYKFILIGAFILLFFASTALGILNKNEDNDEEIENDEVDNNEEIENNVDEINKTLNDNSEEIEDKVGDDDNEEKDTNTNDNN